MHRSFRNIIYLSASTFGINQRHPRPYCDWEHQFHLALFIFCSSVTRLPFSAEQKPTGKSPVQQEETLSGTRTIWEGGASFLFWDLSLDGGRTYAEEEVRR